jgi:hypothetical protein
MVLLAQLAQLHAAFNLIRLDTLRLRMQQGLQTLLLTQHYSQLISGYTLSLAVADQRFRCL